MRFAVLSGLKSGDAVNRCFSSKELIRARIVSCNVWPFAFLVVRQEGLKRVFFIFVFFNLFINQPQFGMHIIYSSREEGGWYL